MTGTAVLEREIKTQDGRELSKEEREHARNMSANYDFLRYSNSAAWTSSDVREKEREELKDKLSSYNPTQERIAAYTATPSAPARNHDLFANYSYQNGELLVKDPETDTMTPVFQDRVVAKPTYTDDAFEATGTSTAIEESVEDDALPTRRTMETVIRPAAAVEEVTITDTKTGLGTAAAISAKLKIILASVITAIVLAIVLICVNTSLISSLDSDISNLRGRAAEEQSTYETLREESDLYTAPDSDIVAEWAESNGMSK